MLVVKWSVQFNKSGCRACAASLNLSPPVPFPCIAAFSNNSSWNLNPSLGQVNNFWQTEAGMALPGAVGIREDRLSWWKSAALKHCQVLSWSPGATELGIVLEIRVCHELIPQEPLRVGRWGLEPRHSWAQLQLPLRKDFPFSGNCPCLAAGDKRQPNSISFISALSSRFQLLSWQESAELFPGHSSDSYQWISRHNSRFSPAQTSSDSEFVLGKALWSTFLPGWIFILP